MRRFNAKPRLRTIDKVDRHSISKENITYLNRHGYSNRTPFANSIQEFDVLVEPARRLHPLELFMCPFIVEVVGAGFDKPTNARYYTLRFPRLLKIHEDRSIKDAIGFEELQELAHDCLAIPEDEEQEEQSWCRKLRGHDVSVGQSITGSPSGNEVAGAKVCAGGQSNRQEELVSAFVSQYDDISPASSKRKVAQDIV